MNRNGGVALLVVVVLGVCLGPVSAGAVDLYTDRAEWEAAVPTVRMMEDFASEIPGTYMTPYSTTAGISVERFGFELDLIFRDGGAVNGSRELLLKDYGGGSIFGFPSLHRQLGFGFDWVTGGEAWTLKFQGQEYTLPGNASGFFGLADADAQGAGFELTSPAVTQDGLAIDDLVFSPALLIFTDRSAWETALVLTPTIEGFEIDTPGSYQTPYTTGGSCDLQDQGVAIDFDIIDPGIIDGSRELHLSDTGTEMTFVFPGGEAQRGFGFDWETTFESWSLVVREEHMSLSGMSEGFIGVVDQTGLTDSFVVRVLGIVQEGIHLDHLSYASGTVPLRPVTWGWIKARFD